MGFLPADHRYILTSVTPTWALVRITPVEMWRNGALSCRAQEGQLDLKRSLRRSHLKDVLYSISQTIIVYIGGWNLRKVKEQTIQRLKGMKKVQCGWKNNTCLLAEVQYLVLGGKKQDMSLETRKGLITEFYMLHERICFILSWVLWVLFCFFWQTFEDLSWIIIWSYLPSGKITVLIV